MVPTGTWVSFTETKRAPSLTLYTTVTNQYRYGVTPWPESTTVIIARAKSSRRQAEYLPQVHTNKYVTTDSCSIAITEIICGSLREKNKNYAQYAENIVPEITTRLLNKNLLFFFVPFSHHHKYTDADVFHNFKNYTDGNRNRELACICLHIEFIWH